MKFKRMLPLLVWLLAFIALGHTLNFSFSGGISGGLSGARAETAAKRTLVGGLPAFPPFAFPEQDGLATRGLMVQMLQAISASGLPKISSPQIDCIQVVPLLGGTQMKISPGRCSNLSQL